MMKRFALAAMILLLALGLGCAKKQMKLEEPSIIGAESLTKRYKGYRTTVEVKAGVKELETVLLNPRIMQMSTSLMKIEFVSGEKFAKLGDRVEYKISSFGLGFNVRAILIHYEPGREIWYSGQGGTGIFLFRFHIEDQGQTTRLTLSCELLEEGSSDFQRLTQLVDIYKLIAQGFDGAIANIQVQFDPSLKKDELLARGIRGEFYESFYVGHQVSMHVDATGEEIFRVFQDPSFWAEFEQKAGVKVGPCFYAIKPGDNPGVCPLRVKLFGDDLVLDTVLSAHSFEKYTFNYFYWGDSRFQFVFDFSEQGGTDIILFYLTPSSNLTNPAMLNVAMNFEKIPDAIKTSLLPLIKSRAETGAKHD
jgi:hypothetical protein